MPQDHQAADAVVNALSRLARLLYRLASEPVTEASQSVFRQAGRAIADAADIDLQAIAGATEPGPGHTAPEDLRTALGVLAGMADAVGDGAIGPAQAAAALSILVEELSTLVDLDALALAASPERRAVLESAAHLIGELVVPGADDAGAEDEALRAPTLTMLLTEKARTEWPDVHAGLQSADVPYSVVDPVDATTGLETLWLPGMSVPLQRTVVRRRGGGQLPVLTWRDHVALTELADGDLSYAALADAYLSSDVRDAESEIDAAILSRVAEAVAAARGE
jgi:hypothetical protein